MEPEKIDFVFLDAANCPWRVRTHPNGTALYVWSDFCQAWVWHSLINAERLLALRQKRLMPADEALLYHELSGRHSAPGV